jgi:uncharacterized protein (DUF885 family)
MILALLLAVSTAAPAASSADAVVSKLIESYFAMYPTRATQAGRADFDTKLEDLSPKRVEVWLQTLDSLEKEMQSVETENRDERLDLDVVRHQIAWERFELRTRNAPGRNPMFWTAVASEAGIYLLLREDQPLEKRIQALQARARLMPRLCSQAQAALGKTAAEEIAPELVQPAARQAKELAQLYETGLGKFSPKLAKSGQGAAKALNALAAFLDKLPARGSPRLGKDYAEAFRLYLNETETPEQLLPRFQQDLETLRKTTAAYGKQVFRELVPNEPMLADDKSMIRRLFKAIEADKDADVAEYTRRWRAAVPELEALVRQKQVITLPEPLTLKISPAPAYLSGQAYGGVFPEGPYRPDGDTLLLLPVPGDGATPAESATFFAAFNRPFSKMIAAHEALPGHYTQLKIAAHQQHKIRVLFPDNVYTEGWGTFVEGLMLDQGWGGPKERLAHLKKALENCARAIVDIRVHTQNASKEEIAAFVRDEALQDAQLGNNLWARTLTTAPQIVTYHLGARRFEELYEAAQKREGAQFSLRAFTDGLMSKGPLPLREYGAR